MGNLEKARLKSRRVLFLLNPSLFPPFCPSPALNSNTDCSLPTPLTPFCKQDSDGSKGGGSGEETESDAEIARRGNAKGVSGSRDVIGVVGLVTV